LNQPPQKTREQRRIDRIARLEFLQKTKARGDNRGWQITESAGIPVWQLVQGGAYHIFTGDKPLQ
jgi:hypothetical protein